MIPNRFWKYVDKDSSPDGCWLWTGGKFTNGYGAFGLEGKLFRAHRLVGFEKFGREACEGMCVCHSCDVRNCVNPDHLWLGTGDDNMADMVAKGRAASGNRNGQRKHPEKTVRGEDHYKSKLTDRDVIEIRLRYLPRIHGVTRGNTRELSEEFGVSTTHIRRIAKGEFWKHLG